MIFGTVGDYRPYDLDRRQRLLVTKDRIDLFQEMFFRGAWSVIGQAPYWCLSDEEISRLGNSYPLEFSR